MLLTSSLNSFVVGFGAYLGFIWTRKLDKLADPSDRRAVGLLFCYGIYALSGAIVARRNYESGPDLLHQAYMVQLAA